MNGYLIALIVFLAWIAFIVFLHRRKVLERFSMNLYGPFIMWKTQRGRDFIYKVAERKGLWQAYSKMSLWICAGAMMLIMGLLLWEATIVPQLSKPPSPELILGIPGLNPVIPVGYGILGLVVAVVFHELAHGIMTRLGEMKVQSLGVLFLVFPMGAFVEPDENELKAASRSKRAKVFAAGPATNVLLAMVFLGLFSGVMMPSVESTHDGALAVGVVQDSPAERAGIQPSSLVVSIDGMPITGEADLDDRTSPEPGAKVSVGFYLSGELTTVDNVTDGVVVSYAVEGYAGYEYGLRSGMVLLSLNGTSIGSVDQISDAMALTHENQDVPVTVMSYDVESDDFTIDSTVTHIVLSNKYDYYQEFYPDENEAAYDGKGYLGTGFLQLGLNYADATYYSDILAHPFEDDRNPDDFARSWLRLIALPFLDLAPLRSPVTDLYAPSGTFEWMPDGAFWILTNAFYWLFWLNLMLGLTNVLPAVPLDGGYLFRDGLDYLVERFRPAKTKAQREKSVSNITLFLALFVLSLILWQIVGPAF